MTGTREWDASTYGGLRLPHDRWGRRTLLRLPLAGDETVLELGCGTGRDATLLLDAVPRGRLVAVDGSAAMIEAARARNAGAVAGGRLAALVHDLTAPLPLPDASVDAVFSVATLHWIDDHAFVFGELARVLRPGGRIALEYGGQGNIAQVDDALRALGVAPDGHRFATPEEEAGALRRAGFTEVAAALRREEPYRAGDELETFLRTIILRGYLASLPESERDGFVRSVAERLPDGAVTYVRMEVAARRP
jgi:trans-aconitate 2-methyltransferase